MISIVVGDILKANADAIVNPANGFLRHGAGLARIIEDAATKRFNANDYPKASVSELNELSDLWNKRVNQWRMDHKVPTIPTGGVHVTSAGVLPFKGVIHAVGPVWGGGDYYEEELLTKVMTNICDTAEDRGWSVAVPAISCGLFRFPVVQAATILVDTANDWCATDTTFYVMPEHEEAFTAALALVR